MAVEAILELVRGIASAFSPASPSATTMPANASRYEPAAAASGVVKAAAGTLWLAYACSASPADLWLILFDETAVPANGTAPMDVVQVPRRDNGQAMIAVATRCTRGISWAASTTRFTLTAAACKRPIGAARSSHDTRLSANS